MAFEQQLTLDLPGPAHGGGPVESGANRQAVRLLSAPELWPMGAACLCGPKGCGKSMLLAARFAEAPRLSAADFAHGVLRDDLVSAGAPLVFEDLDRAFEEGREEARARLESALFHLLNMTAQRGAYLVLSGRLPPARWRVSLPDLRSRLAALPLARIEAPDDAHLTAALRDGFARCGATVDDRTLTYLLLHMERSFDTVARIVARVDALSRRERAPIDRRLAARALRWSAR